MNIKKLTALCLAVSLCFAAFMGCQSKPAEDNNGLPEGAVTTPVSPEELQELIDQGVIEDPNAPKEELEPAPYTKGTVENNVYKNEACDLTLRVPTGWNVKDDYSLCSLMGVTYDFEDNSKNLEAISKLSDIYDVVMTDAAENSSIMVLMQDLNQYDLADTPASEYLEIMKLQFVSDTVTYDIGEISEVSYSGNTYAMMKVVSTPDEGEEATQYFFLREANERMITVMITFPSADPINPDTIFA